MTRPEKHRIRSAFDRAANNYDNAARLQRDVCLRLLTHLRSHELFHNSAQARPPPRLIDAGCGTGYGVRLLGQHWPQAHIVAADFSLRMAALASSALPSSAAGAAIVADMESLPLASSVAEGFWSSLAVQWCDLSCVMREAARVLDAKGWLAVSTLGEGTYGELREAFSRVDQHTHTLGFSTPDQLHSEAARAGFHDIRLQRETITLHYPDLRTLLGAVKAIGANSLGTGRRPGMMGKAAWQTLTAAYETHRTADGLPASYDVILLTACKR